MPNKKKKWFKRQFHGKGREVPVRERSLEKSVKGLQIPERREMNILDADRLEERFKTLCLLQTGLERRVTSGEFKSDTKECITCHAIRFACEPFFYRIPGDTSLPDHCSVCSEEISILEKLGLSVDEISQYYLDCSFKRRFKHTKERLEQIFQFDQRQGSLAKKTALCQHCRSKWPETREYFHGKALNDGGSVLTDSCLACPAERRFIFKEK